MSFGFSVGDFLALGQLALTIYNRCRRCSGLYRDLSNDVGQLALTLSDLEYLVKQSRLDATKRTELLAHGGSCNQVLLDIQKMLDKYESLSSKSRKIQDMLAWNYEGAREIRDRLTAKVVILSAFYNVVTTSSIFRLEDAMDLMLREIRQGQKSADAISVLTTRSAKSPATPQAWRRLIQDLEDLDISAEDANQHRTFIVQWFTKAFEAANATELEAVTRHSQSHRTHLLPREASLRNESAQQAVSSSHHIAPLHSDIGTPVCRFAKLHLQSGLQLRVSVLPWMIFITETVLPAQWWFSNSSELWTLSAWTSQRYTELQVTFHA